jgi:hypothetical protein
MKLCCCYGSLCLPGQVRSSRRGAKGLLLLAGGASIDLAPVVLGLPTVLPLDYPPMAIELDCQSVLLLCDHHASRHLRMCAFVFRLDAPRFGKRAGSRQDVALILKCHLIRCGFRDENEVSHFSPLVAVTLLHHHGVVVSSAGP